MVFILQIAFGVCGGLFLFQIVSKWSLPRITVIQAIGACSLLWLILSIAHLVFMASTAK